MSANTWQELLAVATGDGPTLTAAAAATALPVTAKYTFPANYFTQGKTLRIKASGRISSVSGNTARYDLRYGSTVIFDTNAMPLNTTSKTNVGWFLELILTCRTAGSSGAFFGQGIWTSESYIGSPAATAGGNGSIIVPYNAAPAVGGTVDLTAAQAFDMFYTPGATGGSLTVHQYLLEALN